MENEEVQNEDDFLEVKNLTVDEQAEVALLKAQIVSITNELTALKATIAHLSTLDIENTGTIKSMAFTGNTLDVEEITANSITINEFPVVKHAKIEEVESEKIQSASIASESITVKDMTVEESLSANKIKTKELLLEQMKTSNIIANGKINLGNKADMVLKIPYFESGMYCVKFSYNNEVFASVEIHNSLDNYCVRWSQKENDMIKNIYKSIEKEPVILLRLNNKKALNVEAVYGCFSTSVLTNCMKNCVSFPDKAIAYDVKYLNGTKFFSNVE